MFAHYLCHSQIEYLSNSTRREPLGRTIDLNRKDRATRGASACAARAIPQIFKNTKSKSKSGKVTDLTNLKEGQTINMMQMAAVVGANNKLEVSGLHTRI
jgi:hypothetical protein